MKNRMGKLVIGLFTLGAAAVIGVTTTSGTETKVSATPAAIEEFAGCQGNGGCPSSHYCGAFRPGYEGICYPRR